MIYTVTVYIQKLTLGHIPDFFQEHFRSVFNC